MKTNIYYINYPTGDEPVLADAETLDQAMSEADEGAAYTQEPITIEYGNGNVLARRRWWCVGYDPDEDTEKEDEIIDFGAFGFYGAWQV